MEAQNTIAQIVTMCLAFNQNLICMSRIFIQGEVRYRNLSFKTHDKWLKQYLHSYYENLPTLQSLTGSLQGENRVFPVKFSHIGKNLGQVRREHSIS